ncbi:MAG TPA: FtsH protease activity modulator HflK [Gammaproteobacteria bacterium]|nr:FtsH protease activity modulator HflK [Gammaproteobacteria bacterium]
MAWNQPGGNGKDPWGNRGSQGPPDLDEVLKKLQSKLGRMFGGRRGGMPGGGGFRFGAGGAIGFGAILIGALVIWGLSGIYIVDPPEQGVVLRFGEHVRTVGPGPHWRPRFIEDVITVNVQTIRNQDIGFRRQAASVSSVPHEALMLTEDENIVDLQFNVQYRVKDPADFVLEVVDPEITLKQATESAVREIVGRSTMDFVITEGRSEVAAEAGELIQQILDRYGTGLQLTSVNMQDAQPPDPVQEAFLDAIRAREDQERIINEANAYKADIVPKARGEGAAILQRAEAYRQRIIAEAEGETDRFLKVLAEYRQAPAVTRERLYIESMESVLVNSSKVMVDVQGGNSLIYLPIDRLLGSRMTNLDDGEGLVPRDRSVPQTSRDDAERTRSGLRERNR